MPDPDDLLSPAHCVSHALQKTARRVSAIYSEELRACGLGRAQFPILETLSLSGGSLPTSVLARRLDLDRTTLTRTLGLLEKAGLVVREADARDARVRTVRITDGGRDRLDDGRSAWRRAQARTLERIGSDVWRALEADLQQLRRALS